MMTKFLKCSLLQNSLWWPVCAFSIHIQGLFKNLQLPFPLKLRRYNLMVV